MYVHLLMDNVQQFRYHSFCGVHCWKVEAVEMVEMVVEFEKDLLYIHEVMHVTYNASLCNGDDITVVKLCWSLLVFEFFK